MLNAHVGFVVDQYLHDVGHMCCSRTFIGAHLREQVSSDCTLRWSSVLVHGKTVWNHFTKKHNLKEQDIVFFRRICSVCLYV